MTDLPIALPDLALAFCKEVLGWKDAKKSPQYVIPIRNYIWSDTAMERLMFYDLTAIMNAVQKWCDEQTLFLKLIYFPNGKAFKCIFTTREGYGVHGPEHSNPCYALLAACLKAHRELMEKARA